MNTRPVMLITGASQGIGAATAKLAAARGYAVCVNYLQNHIAADEVVRSIRDAGGQAVAIQADVSVESDIFRLLQQTSELLGTPQVLVNNAATLEQQMSLEDMDAARMQRMFAVNTIGPMLCAREAVRRMSTKRGGSGGQIVNISSGASRSGSPGEYVDYAASKGALETFTVGLAKEVAADGIRVNAVRSGYVYTGIHAKGGEPARVDRVKSRVPMQRGGNPEEIAKAVLWLASDDASYVTGAILDVAGGL